MRKAWMSVAPIGACLFGALAACSSGATNGGAGGPDASSADAADDAHPAVDASTPLDAKATSDASPDAPSAVGCAGEPATLSLSGTWAAVVQLSVSLQGASGGALSVCPSHQVGAASALLLVTMQQDAADPTKIDTVKSTVCSLSLPTFKELVGTCDPTSASLVSTQLSPPASLAAASATGTATLGGHAPGASVSFSPLDMVAGSSSPGASLPTWDTSSSGCNQQNIGMTNVCDTMCVSNCAALRDDDQDGFPGISLELCGATSSDTMSGAQCHASMPNTPGTSLQGLAYTDLDLEPTFTGTANSSCEIQGTAASTLVYNLVGANVYLAGSPITVTSVIASLPTFAVDPSASKLRMVRVDGQYGALDLMIDPTQPTAACAKIVAQAGQF